MTQLSSLLSDAVAWVLRQTYKHCKIQWVRRGIAKIVLDAIKIDASQKSGLQESEFDLFGNLRTGEIVIINQDKGRAGEEIGRVRPHGDGWEALHSASGGKTFEVDSVNAVCSVLRIHHGTGGEQ